MGSSPTTEQQALPLAGLDFGAPKQVALPETMAAENVHQFQDKDVFKLLDQDKFTIEDLPVESNKVASHQEQKNVGSATRQQEEHSQPVERVPTDVAGKF